MSVQQPTDSLEAGAPPLEVIGPYRVIERLAAGELANVYAARLLDSPELDEVAIKLLHAEQIHDRARREALKREAAISTMATPRGRVMAYVDDVRPYLVMQRVEGASLSELLGRSRARGVDGSRFATTLLLQILGELQAFHDGSWSESGAPLLHQAPCARHILVSHDGTARLTDFTFALCPSLPPNPLDEGRIRASEMAPEQALAPAHVGPGCDLFVVGIALWEALTEKPLFAASSREEALEKLLREPILAPSQVGASCRSSLDRVCGRALARSRSERYRSAAEMADDLRADARRAGLIADREHVVAWVASMLEREQPRPECNPRQGAPSAGSQARMHESSLPEASVTPESRAPSGREGEAEQQASPLRDPPTDASGVARPEQAPLAEAPHDPIPEGGDRGAAIYAVTSGEDRDASILLGGDPARTAEPKPWRPSARRSGELASSRRRWTLGLSLLTVASVGVVVSSASLEGSTERLAEPLAELAQEAPRARPAVPSGGSLLQPSPHVEAPSAPQRDQGSASRAPSAATTRQGTHRTLARTPTARAASARSLVPPPDYPGGWYSEPAPPSALPAQSSAAGTPPGRGDPGRAGASTTEHAPTTLPKLRPAFAAPRDVAPLPDNPY